MSHRITFGRKLQRPDDRTIGRFMRKIDFTGADVAPHCWRWGGTYRQDDRYGIVNVSLGHYSKVIGGDPATPPKKKWCSVHAHRLSYAIFFGSVPDGADVHHVCGNPQCVNPMHLQVASRGTHGGEGEVATDCPHCGAKSNKETKEEVPF